MNTRKKDDPYLQAVGERIKNILKEKHLSQSDVERLASEKGFEIRQADISKICGGKSANPRAETLAQIAATLDVSLDDLLSLDVTKTSISKKTHSARKPLTASTVDKMFITTPDNPHMKNYLKTFHVYFFPTKSDENEIIKGELEFKRSDDNQKVIAILDFKTGKNDEQGKEITKHYEGELVISPFMYSAYCWLKNDEIGEILYMIFNYIPIAYEGLYSRVALVLTSCAGDPRVPTALRMLISIPEIKDEDLEIIKGQLYLNGREILISELGMNEMLKRKEIQENDGIKNLLQREGKDLSELGVKPVMYYKFEEASIRSTFLDDESKLLLINLLRQYASMPRYIKVGKKSDKFLYNFLQRKYVKKNKD